MARILVADDERDITELVRRYAERDGHEVTCVSDGAEAIAACKDQDFDVCVLDVMMPEVDGLRACREITSSYGVPVILLTARGDEYDRLFGFEVGADDYVVKPFSPKELMARIGVVARRHAPRPATADDEGSASPDHRLIELGDLKVDLDAHEVFVCGDPVTLTAKEYDVLVCLARRPGVVLRRPQILSEVWGYDEPGQDRTVDWQVKLLRGKLGACRSYVETVRGVGYKVRVP